MFYGNIRRLSKKVSWIYSQVDSDKIVSINMLKTLTYDDKIFIVYMIERI